jgi:hypothetical protein
MQITSFSSKTPSIFYHKELNKSSENQGEILKNPKGRVPRTMPVGIYKVSSILF